MVPFPIFKLLKRNTYFSILVFGSQLKSEYGCWRRLMLHPRTETNKSSSRFISMYVQKERKKEGRKEEKGDNLAGERP